MIELDIEIGDVLLAGKFKNKKIIVKSIEYDDYGLPLINGRPLLTMRIEKLMNKTTNESKISLVTILKEVKKEIKNGSTNIR